MLLVQVAGSARDRLADLVDIPAAAIKPRTARRMSSLRPLAYTLLACLASAVITSASISWSRGRSDDDAIQMGLRTSTTAVWFAAATILLAEMSPRHCRPR